MTGELLQWIYFPAARGPQLIMSVIMEKYIHRCNNQALIEIHFLKGEDVPQSEVSDDGTKVHHQASDRFQGGSTTK